MSCQHVRVCACFPRPHRDPRTRPGADRPQLARRRSRRRAAHDARRGQRPALALDRCGARPLGAARGVGDGVHVAEGRRCGVPALPRRAHAARGGASPTTGGGASAREPAVRPGPAVERDEPEVRAVLPDVPAAVPPRPRGSATGGRRARPRLRGALPHLVHRPGRCSSTAWGTGCAGRGPERGWTAPPAARSSASPRGWRRRATPN